MEALRGRKYQIIAMAAIVAVVAAGVVGTLTDSGGTDLPERYHQHEKAQQLADLPEADRVAASGTNICRWWASTPASRRFLASG